MEKPRSARARPRLPPESTELRPLSAPVRPCVRLIRHISPTSPSSCDGRTGRVYEWPVHHQIPQWKDHSYTWRWAGCSARGAGPTALHATRGWLLMRDGPRACCSRTRAQAGCSCVMGARACCSRTRTRAGCSRTNDRARCSYTSASHTRLRGWTR